MEFKNAIFAGGGSRCLWQLGFWDGANELGLGLAETVDYANPGALQETYNLGVKDGKRFAE